MYATSAEQGKRAQVQSLAAELYSDKYTQLLATARKHAATNAEAEEAVQDALTAFIAHFDPDRGAPPIAWILLTLKRFCWEKRRHLRLGKYVCPEASSRDDEPVCVIEEYAAGLADTEWSVERVEEVVEARQRFARLKPDERTALGLFGLGYSYKEIAELRGWTYTKVNRCISEGRLALRRWA